jgi:hypothetical protein
MVTLWCPMVIIIQELKFHGIDTRPEFQAPV